MEACNLCYRGMFCHIKAVRIRRSRNADGEFATPASSLKSHKSLKNNSCATLTLFLCFISSPYFFFFYIFDFISICLESFSEARSLLFFPCARCVLTLQVSAGFCGTIQRANMLLQLLICPSLHATLSFRGKPVIRHQTAVITRQRQTLDDPTHDSGNSG